MIATEWNVRGYGTDGSRNATWAKAIDDIFKTVILPNYEIGFYFALTNNWAGRGGTTTARPGSLLKHSTSLSVSPSSSFSALEDYYNTPIVPSEPFYFHLQCLAIRDRRGKHHQFRFRDRALNAGLCRSQRQRHF